MSAEETRAKRQAVKTALDQYRAPVMWEAYRDPGTASRSPSINIGGTTLHGHRFNAYAVFTEEAFATMTVDQLVHATMTVFQEEISKALSDLKLVHTWFKDRAAENDVGGVQDE